MIPAMKQSSGHGILTCRIWFPRSSGIPVFPKRALPVLKPCGLFCLMQTPTIPSTISTFCRRIWSGPEEVRPPQPEKFRTETLPGKSRAAMKPEAMIMVLLPQIWRFRKSWMALIPVLRRPPVPERIRKRLFPGMTGRSHAAILPAGRMMSPGPDFRNRNGKCCGAIPGRILLSEKAMLQKTAPMLI